MKEILSQYYKSTKTPINNTICLKKSSNSLTKVLI